MVGGDLCINAHKWAHARLWTAPIRARQKQLHFSYFRQWQKAAWLQAWQRWSAGPPTTLVSEQLLDGVQSNFTHIFVDLWLFLLPLWNISSSTRWTGIKVTHIHGPRMMNPNEFSHLLTFPHLPFIQNCGLWWNNTKINAIPISPISTLRFVLIS